MKILLTLLILCSFVYGEFQKVSIGSIDSHYKNMVSNEELFEIIKEIENLFESQLNIDVFDYSQDGIPINIVYIPPSKKAKKLSHILQKIQSLKDDIENFSFELTQDKDSLQRSQKILRDEYDLLNESIEKLNSYVEDINQNSKNLSKNDYNNIQKYISDEQKYILTQKNILNKKKRNLNRKIRSNRQKIRKYNLLVKRYNRYQREAEQLSKSIKEIKGVTKFNTKISYIKDGDTIIEKSSKTYMQKIEIYDFEDLTQLKVILAHEIGHLVGVEHVDSKGALMNPYLQTEQIENLSLTYDDIQAFYKVF